MDAKLIAGLPRPRPFRLLRLWKNIRRPVFILLLAGVGLTGATRAQTQSPPSSSRHTGESHTPKQSMLQEPSGAERCVVCHPAEVQGFSQSAMAHALRRAGQEPEGVVEAHGSKIT